MKAEELKEMALCGETTTVQFKQEFTTQKDIAKEMVALANTHGGKILFGVTENSEILALFQESGAFKPELQAVSNSSVSDLEITSVNEYFEKNFGREKEAFGMSVESLLQSQNILTRDNELTVVGALFFARNPQRFMPAFVIKAVAYFGNDIAGSEYRDSRDISGTIPWMFREAMSFAKSNLHHRQNGQNFNKTGILEIPEVVLEELIQNSLVHLDLVQPAAIRLLIFDNRVEIINPGCLFGGLEVSDILLGVTKQRNPAMAAMSGRTMIYRGLGSGILRAIKEGVKIDFINNEKTNEFKAVVWMTDFTESVTENVTETLQRVYKGFTKGLQSQHFDVLNLIYENKNITTTEMSVNLGVSRQIVARRIKFLQDRGFLKRIGGKYGGSWEICIPDNEEGHESQG